MCDFIIRNKELFEQLDIFINSIDNKEDSLMYILHNAQNLFGYIPKDVQNYISKKLDIPAEKISELINFYSYFSTELKGDYKINVCVSGACAKNNSQMVLEEFESQLGIKTGFTTNDSKFNLESSGCIGVCRRSPIVTVSGKVYERVNPKDVENILNECE